MSDNEKAARDLFDALENINPTVFKEYRNLAFSHIRRALELPLRDAESANKQCESYRQTVEIQANDMIVMKQERESHIASILYLQKDNEQLYKDVTAARDETVLMKRLNEQVNSLMGQKEFRLGTLAAQLTNAEQTVIRMAEELDQAKKVPTANLNDILIKQLDDANRHITHLQNVGTEQVNEIRSLKEEVKNTTGIIKGFMVMLETVERKQKPSVSGRLEVECDHLWDMHDSVNFGSVVDRSYVVERVRCSKCGLFR